MRIDPGTLDALEKEAQAALASPDSIKPTYSSALTPVMVLAMIAEIRSLQEAIYSMVAKPGYVVATVTPMSQDEQEAILNARPGPIVVGTNPGPESFFYPKEACTSVAKLQDGVLQGKYPADKDGYVLAPAKPPEAGVYPVRFKMFDYRADFDFATGFAKFDGRGWGLSYPVAQEAARSECGAGQQDKDWKPEKVK